ncbi:GNAT family N-acetyltransferase [Vibrio sp. NTOU-M3]|uniref:GNAT family N-acetyltransferase n=1 Tax=Vibrio sp. NTOU-M3 TaxID=3234954 RepID=UPI00349F6EFD
MRFLIGDLHDAEEIKTLFTSTFSDSEGEGEGKLIGQLALDLITTTAKSELLACIAKEEDKIVASILFTQLEYENGEKPFLMAPVAVLTDYQGKGVGQKLIQFGLTQMKEMGVKLIFTYGDPSFYSKSGFLPVSEEAYPAPYKLAYPHGWQANLLTDNALELIKGTPSCVKAFQNPALW